MVWTLVVMVLIWSGGCGCGRRCGPCSRNRRQLGLLSIAAVAISFNWGFYIWAVNAGQVVEASFGYFINPLMTIVVGVVVLGERLRRHPVGRGRQSQPVAIVVIAVDYGQLPWIALILATSFTVYGLMKKKAEVGAAESLTVEIERAGPARADDHVRPRRHRSARRSSITAPATPRCWPASGSSRRFRCCCSPPRPGACR